MLPAPVWAWPQRAGTTWPSRSSILWRAGGGGGAAAGAVCCGYGATPSWAQRPASGSSTPANPVRYLDMVVRRLSWVPGNMDLEVEADLRAGHEGEQPIE